MKVKIYGAGSIGNHLAHACRSKGWSVTMCDVDQSALDRTKNEIYPSRYGSWDESIEVYLVKDAPKLTYDLVIIGTPPDTHNMIAIDVLQTNAPRVILIEKPVCTPSLENAQEVVDLAAETGTIMTVGYNHVVTENTKRVEALLAKRAIGSPISISARFREHWGGIFGAHPWLDGPGDTYLGYFERGGGASGEHSHAINIWQHFAHCCNMGRITQVSAQMDMIIDGNAKYDRICLLNVKTEKGFIGDIAQDVITQPAQKLVRIQGDEGFIEWQAGRDANHDSVQILDNAGNANDDMISRTRPQDFQGEIDELDALLKSGGHNSSILLTRGLDTMLIVAAAHLSYTQNRSVQINYSCGYSLDALEII